MNTFLLDMDGVLYHGNKVLPHAREFVAALAGFKYLFITNNPVAPPEAVASKLRQMGFGNIHPDHILTSAQATALWLERQKPGFRYFAVGGSGLYQALSEVGTADNKAADFVVVGEGPGLDYQSLTTGINLVLSKDATLVSTNPDTNVDAWEDHRHLIFPGGGALVAPFEIATGHKAITIGKPGPLLFEMALEQLGSSVKDSIMIGDRPDTDIAGASALGMRSALVRTGRFLPGEPWPEAIPQPDWDVDSLQELFESLEKTGILD